MIKRSSIFIIHLGLAVSVIYVIITEHNWKISGVTSLVSIMFFAILILLSLLGILGHLKILLKGEELKRK
jgi:hypothetical protein